MNLTSAGVQLLLAIYLCQLPSCLERITTDSSSPNCQTKKEEYWLKGLLFKNLFQRCNVIMVLNSFGALISY